MIKNDIVRRKKNYMRNSKQALVEHIMSKVAPIVKRTLNEGYEDEDEDVIDYDGNLVIANIVWTLDDAITAFEAEYDRRPTRKEIEYMKSIDYSVLEDCSDGWEALRDVISYNFDGYREH